MLTATVKAVRVLALCGAILLYGRIALADGPSSRGKCAQSANPCNLCSILGKPCGKCARTARAEQFAPEPVRGRTSGCPASDTSCVPPNPQPGECYARSYIPATFRTVTERHLVKEASERLEVIPAEVKWVEERVCVKDAVTQLEVEPAEYKWIEKTIEVQPAYTGWVVQNAANCTTPDKQNISCVFCLRTTPPQYKTIRTQVVAKPASVREVTTPAEYETVRKQIVVKPATTRKVAIPPEYEDVEKRVLECPERVKWVKVVCEEKLSAENVNKVKSALLASGFQPGPLNGQLEKADWVALNAFQQKNKLGRLGMGQLSYETLKQLGVAID